MILVGAENVRLLCCNCGGVFKDVWGSYPTVPQPVCPYCEMSYYRDTDEEESPKYHGPTKKHYKVSSKVTDSMKEFDFWSRYQNIRAELDKQSVDEMIAHERAMKGAYSVSSINHFILGNSARVDSYRKYWREVAWPRVNNSDTFVQFPAEISETLQLDFKEMVAEVVHLWDSGKTYGLTFIQAVNLTSPGYCGNVEDLREYFTIKRRVSRVRKQILERREESERFESFNSNRK
ncbi:hypothetical protein LCGC14_1485750 [marine sediment metagenome]|uniref:Uncharacterized protein n=1 Tax=marine sediment metagenome TaxID=412755 RepID=A0A0F9J8V5_9ZZZZ